MVEADPSMVEQEGGMMALIMTSEYCPTCDQRIYMVGYPKKRDDDSIIMSILEFEGKSHTIIDGIYLDRDGVCCIVQFDEFTKAPEYYCIHCQWHS